MVERAREVEVIGDEWLGEDETGGVEETVGNEEGVVKWAIEGVVEVKGLRVVIIEDAI